MRSDFVGSNVGSVSILEAESSTVFQSPFITIYTKKTSLELRQGLDVMVCLERGGEGFCSTNILYHQIFLHFF